MARSPGRNAVGKLVGDTLYVHRSAISELGDSSKQLLKQAVHVLGTEPKTWNVVRISTERIAFLEYEDFDGDPFPKLAHSTMVDITRSVSRKTSYREYKSRPILHRKELLVRKDYPGRELFAALTEELEKQSLFYDAHRIGYSHSWEKRLKAQGLQIVDHILYEQAATSDASVSRHKTAIVRYRLSQPVALLLRHGLLKEPYTFFDFGCGQGDDIKGLQHSGVNANGWDPHFAPDNPRIRSSVVNLGFVLNVIEDPTERTNALRMAWNLAEKVLAVSVMTPSSGAVENLRPYGDGFLTSRGTFQKYFTQEQMREYVRQTLCQDPIAVAPGIFFVFRDKLDEQLFMLERFNRHSFRAIAFSTTRSRLASSDKPLKMDLLRPHLEQLSAEILDHGRLVAADELSEEIHDAFRSENVSLKRAEQACLDELIDPKTLEEAGASRREDLLVYFALEMFSGRQPYRQLPKGLQRDIRIFFGSHANAQTEARRLLFSTGETSTIRKACEEFSELELGYINAEGHLVFHSSAANRLPAILRCYIGCASVLYGDIDAADLLKVHMHSGKLTLHTYDDFSNLLPTLERRAKINLRAQRVQVFEYGSNNRQYLFMKSLYLPDGHPELKAQQSFDRSLHKLSAFDFSNYGPDADHFDTKLEEMGWAIDDNGLTPIGDA